MEQTVRREDPLAERAEPDLEGLMGAVIDGLVCAGSSVSRNPLSHCLEVLVHVAGADGGFLEDHHGRIVAAEGVAMSEIENMSEGGPAALCSYQAYLVAASDLLSVPPVRLSLLCRGPYRHVDLGLTLAFAGMAAFALSRPSEAVS